MKILRSVKESDIDGLYELSQLVQFLNLPSDIELIKEKVLSAVKTFEKPSKDPKDNHFIFVLEDTDEKKVIGVSMIHGQHGTFNQPHFYLKIGVEKTFSETLKKRINHQTLKLEVETDGPTEIGGLVLHPDYRNNKEKLGKQISFIRFLYMGNFRQYFRENILSELMPPLDENGNSPLWESIGRKFFNMDYLEADKLSLTNKEFILNLFPSGIIYTSLLDRKAQDSIGEIGPDTAPVRKMLTSIGFEYANEIDPFDGGPHYKAKRDEITLIKNLFKGLLELNQNEKFDKYYLVAQFDNHNFIANRTLGFIQEDKFIVPVTPEGFDPEKMIVVIPC